MSQPVDTLACTVIEIQRRLDKVQAENTWLRGRNNLLRIALLEEWKQLKIQFADAAKQTVEAHRLESHIEVIAAVLRRDTEHELAKIPVTVTEDVEL